MVVRKADVFERLEEKHKIVPRYNEPRATYHEAVCKKKKKNAWIKRCVEDKNLKNLTSRASHLSLSNHRQLFVKLKNRGEKMIGTVNKTLISCFK